MKKLLREWAGKFAPILKKSGTNPIFTESAKHSIIIKCCSIFVVVSALVVFSSKAKAASQPISQRLWHGVTQEDLQVLKKISVAIESKKYDEALKFASDLKKEEGLNDVPERSRVVKKKSDFSEAITSLILWNKFSGSINPKGISFNDISRFSLDNQFYPNIRELNRNVEKVAIAENIPYQRSEKYFDKVPAGTTESKIYLLRSKIDFLVRTKVGETERQKRETEIKKLLSDIWVKENFSDHSEADFLEKYQNRLTEVDHINRIDRLLWDGKITEVRRIMNLVNKDYQRLFLAVIEIQNLPKYIDSIILSVPRKLRSNEGLSYRRALWYKSKDRLDDLLDVMVDLPEVSQFPEKWWSLRRLYGREMIKKKEYKTAYALIRKHSLSADSSDFWEAEWMSGWIALRFLDRPKVAYEHFEKLYKNVKQPVTLSRAAYWLGMASEGMNDRSKAIQWYKEAAKYPIFFYGQLAIHKHRSIDSIGAQDDIILPKDPEIKVADMNKISASRSAQVAYLLAILGDKDNAQKVFEWSVNEADTPGEIAVLMKLVNEIGDPQLDVKIARSAARKNVFFIKDKFQIVKSIESDEYAPLIHAIVKQESGFAPTAVSHVGALGFMQIMPDTAKLLAKDLKIPYDRDKLATDIKYNVHLGSYYIKKLINRFDGSEMLAIASYNAGPNATQRWINEFYDPRKEKDLDKVVDWIELITYSETRNYVQRIMENLIVYKYLMSRSNYDSIQ